MDLVANRYCSCVFCSSKNRQRALHCEICRCADCTSRIARELARSIPRKTFCEIYGVQLDFFDMPF